MKKNEKPEADISKVLGAEGASGQQRYRRWWVLVCILIIILGIAFFMSRGAGKTNSIQYKTIEARRGDLIVTVSATGNLEPTNQVEVGSELSGIVKAVEVNYNDRVATGQVLARLDTEKLKAQVLQSEAALQSSEAKVLEAQANMMDKGSNLERLKRLYEDSNHRLPSRQDLDTAEAAFKSAQAAEAMAKAGVAEARARLETSKTDLSKALIRSPINGIVLSRNVEPGQTVAASLQAPVLFILAEDLTQMELHVDVDEADVGQVEEGQEAFFTVDAYPDQRFPAQITQVRYAAKTVEGVVTYETILGVDNSTLLLRPGMTATADIIVKKIENALLVPNAALRFSPPQQVNGSKGSNSLVRMLLPRPPPRPSKERQNSHTNPNQQRVWILSEGKPVPMFITIGSSDGEMTEVLEGKIEPGLPLLVDILGKG